MSSDLTFITNEPGIHLRDRFGVLLSEDTRFFDCLVGYFFISDFHKLHPALTKTEKILDKFFLGAAGSTSAVELDFMSAANILKPADPNEPRQSIPREFYDLLDRNKVAFVTATTADAEQAAAIAFVFEAKSAVSELPNSVVKPWIKVGDVYRYAIQPIKKRFLVYSNDLERISEYPKFQDWLKQHSEKLKNRREVKNGRIRWFDLQWPREKRFFDNDKFICRFKAERNTFAYDTEGLYCSADITLVILKDEFRKKFSPKYILALLNSRLLDYHFKSYAKLMDYRYEYYPKPVSLLRIRHASESEQKPFIPLVDRILAAKARDAAADVSGLEWEIDHLVYALYGLTPEGIQIVEAAAK